MKKGDIKWDPLWRNFKNFQPAWRHLTLKAFLIGLLVSTFRLGLSGLDLGLDINMSYLYIHGDTYMYLLNNETHDLITSLNCTFQNETHHEVDVTGITTDTLIYHCFVRDKVYGYLSLAFTILPGFLAVYFVGQKLWKSSKTSNFIIFIIMIPVQVALFPVMLIVVKVSIFSELINLKKKALKNPCLEYNSYTSNFFSGGIYATC